MKQIIFYIFLLLVFILFTNCEKTKKIDGFTDEEFINFISSDNYKESIFRIDSLAKNGVNSTHRTGLLYLEKGSILGSLEKDLEAKGSLTKALMLFEKEDNKLYIAKTNMLLSDSNAFLSNLDIARNQINVALEIFRELNDKKGEAKALNSLAHIEYLNFKFDKSIEYVIDAAAIQEELKDTATLSASYNNIGYIFEQIKDFTNAKSYYKKAMQLNIDIERLNSHPLRNLGYVSLLENDLIKSKSLYLQALKIEEKAGVLANQKDIYDLLLELSIKDMNFNNASLYVKKRDSLNELITEFENTEKIKLIQNQYNLITKESELKQEKKDNQKNKIILGILVGLLSLLGLSLYQRNKNTKLRLDQEKLLLEQKMLRTQMNPHFIFNALTAIQNTIFENDPLKSSTYLSRFAKLIRQNFEFVSKKEIYLEEDLDALKNYIATQQLRFKNKFDYEINLDNDVNASLIRIPPMLLQPFVENAIEHGLKPKKEKGMLKINISKQDSLVKFEVIDNGIGYNKDENVKDREHAIDIFLKRLKLRNQGEEKLFSIQSLNEQIGTKVIMLLNLH
ncbi:histidine kinase [Aureibaculum sp. A20]|uniref:Histidine kinase n=1 Tax=Aureibaculum flavum TaxID=2795986 RepID=A0ABS0WUS0_9FLAO|nr:histidine kinase [Aureibaculum flavum]MBJ2175705.1 histidine kinase [Aureibaculum flavum]